MKVFDGIDINKLKEYVLSRQNEDGRFAICKPLPSSLPETYYAVYILKSAGIEIPNKEKIVRFLRNNVRNEIYSIYYTFNSLNVLGEAIPDLSDFLLQRLYSALNGQSSGNVGGGGITATYSFEMPNVLRKVYIITSSLKLLGEKVPREAKIFVRGLRKGGGFGVSSPNLQETYYSVCILGEDVRDVKNDVIAFVKRLECDGGFLKAVNSYPPYIEETFYALSCFKQLGHSYRNKKTVEYILSLQNPDGGFRRSIHGGISSLEYTYYAVASLKYFEEG